MRPIHTTEGSLFYSKFTNLNVNLIQKYPHKNLRNDVWPHTWTPWLAKSTHKINYTPLHRVLCAQSLSHVWLFATHGLQPTRLLCPWGFSRPEYWSVLPCSPPGDQGSNPGPPHCRQILYHLSHQGSPQRILARIKSVGLCKMLWTVTGT